MRTLRKPTRRAAVRAIAATPFLARALLRPARAAAPIRLFSVPNENGLLGIFADQQGFFKKYGLDVAVEIMPNGGTIMSALIGGSADAGVSNPITLSVAHVRGGVSLKCFAGTSFYTNKAPTALLIVAKDAPFRTARDLNGKTIATVELKSIAQMATALWLDKNGGDSSSIKFIEMHFGEMANALVRERVDAAFCAEPALSNAGDAVRVFADTYGAIAPRFLAGVHLTTEKFASANPAVVRGLSLALRDAADWANGHKEESGEILARVTKIDLDVVRKMRRSTFANRIAPEFLQPPIDLAARYGAIPASFPASDVIWTGA